MSKGKQIQYLHLATMAAFIVLGTDGLFIHLLPGVAGIIGVGFIYLGLFVETVMVRRAMADYEGPMPPAIRSLLMTRFLIGAMSVVVIAAYLGRVGKP